MPQTLSSRLSVICGRLQTVLLAKVGDTSFFTPAIQDVYYGDQELIPAVPAVCVEPVTSTREWPPDATYQTKLDLQVSILIYFANQSGAGVESIRLTTDKLAETVAEYLNMNYGKLPDAGGNELVVYSAVTKIESAYAYKGKTLYRSSNLTWQARSKTSLLIAQ